MRWQAKKKREVGDIKEEELFLIFPLCINGEWRWMETATLRYECVEYVDYDTCSGYLRWELKEWAD